MTMRERAALDHRALEAAEARKRPVLLVQLIATVALALSTMIAVTAVSIGIARAEAFGVRADWDTAPLAIALLLGLLWSAMGAAILADESNGRA